MIDTSELMFDPDFCETFTVLRSGGGRFLPGGYKPNSATISMYGAAQVADANTMLMVPEGDRVLGARVFWSNAQIFITQGGNKGTGDVQSDVILYHGQRWKVMEVWDRSANGFFKAYAVREGGV